MGLASSGPQHLWLALGPSQHGKPLRQVQDEQLIRKGKSVGSSECLWSDREAGQTMCAHSCAYTSTWPAFNARAAKIWDSHVQRVSRSCHGVKVCGLEIQGECTDLTGKWTCPGVGWGMGSEPGWATHSVKQ